MTAGPWSLTNGALARIVGAYRDGGSARTFKVALVTSSSNIGASSTTWAGVTGQVANGNGYTTDGIAVTLSDAGTAPSFALKFASNPVWTATGGSIVARRAVIYEVGGNVVAHCLLDNTNTDVTVTSGNQLSVDSDGDPGPLVAFNVS